MLLIIKLLATNTIDKKIHDRLWAKNDRNASNILKSKDLQGTKL